MADVYSVVNGANPTTAAAVKVTTGTAIKTLLQLATPATKAIKVVSWFIDFDGSAAATPIQVELLHTDVAATVTAYAAGDITTVQTTSPSNTTALTLGTAASGYTASAEGTIASGKVFEAHNIPPTSGYLIQYPLGREPVVPVSRFLRIRVTAGTAVNAYCGVTWEE